MTYSNYSFLISLKLVKHVEYNIFSLISDRNYFHDLFLTIYLT